MKPRVTIRNRPGRGTIVRVSAKTRVPYWRGQTTAFAGYRLVPGPGECLVLAVSYPPQLVRKATDLMRWLPQVNWVAPVTMRTGERKRRGPWSGLEVYLPRDFDAPPPGSSLAFLKKRDTTFRMPIVCLVVPME